MIYTIRENQSILDIALQLYGDVSYMVKLCVDNDLDINDELVTGSNLLIDDIISNEATLPTTYKLRDLIVTTDGSVEYDTVAANANMLEHSPEEYTENEHN